MILFFTVINVDINHICIKIILSNRTCFYLFWFNSCRYIQVLLKRNVKLYLEFFVEISELKHRLIVNFKQFGCIYMIFNRFHFRQFNKNKILNTEKFNALICKDHYQTAVHLQIFLMTRLQMLTLNEISVLAFQKVVIEQDFDELQKQFGPCYLRRLDPKQDPSYESFISTEKRVKTCLCPTNA